VGLFRRVAPYGAACLVAGFLVGSLAGGGGGVATFAVALLATGTPTATATPSSTPTPSVTMTPTPTVTPTGSPTATSTATSTATPSPTPTLFALTPACQEARSAVYARHTTMFGSLGVRLTCVGQTPSAEVLVDVAWFSSGREHHATYGVEGRIIRPVDQNARSFDIAGSVAGLLRLLR